MVGMVLGFAISFVMNAFIIAGELIGIQMGINLISALDPVAGGQVPILGQFMGLLGMLIFLAIDGHHMMFEALVASFQLVPPMHVHFSGFLVESELKLGVNMFVLALKVGAPVMTALLNGRRARRHRQVPRARGRTPRAGRGRVFRFGGARTRLR